MSHSARVSSKKQEHISTPPKGYLSVAQAALASHSGRATRKWNTDQLHRYIKLGHLPALIIEPTPGPKDGPGRKTKLWIHPDDLAGLKLMSPGPKRGQKKASPSIAASKREARDAKPPR